MAAISRSESEIRIMNTFVRTLTSKMGEFPLNEGLPSFNGNSYNFNNFCRDRPNLSSLLSNKKIGFTSTGSPLIRCPLIGWNSL